MIKETVSAFPNPYYSDVDGMTLRDYFAAKAMQGLLAYGWKTEENVAPKAYAMADEMLKQREIER